MHTIADRTPALRRAGSFWHQMLVSDQREQARHMAHASFLTALDDELKAAARALVGGGWEQRDSLALPWEPSNVVMVGPDLQERLLTLWAEDGAAEGTGMWIAARPMDYDLGRGDHAQIQVTLPDGSDIILKADSCNYYLFPAEGENDELPVVALDLRPKWLVPVPLDVRPISLEVPGRMLVAGIDFICQPGALVFQENPHFLFSDRLICQGAWLFTGYAFNYSQAADLVTARQRHIALFQQEAQSPTTVLGALAELTGREIAEADALVTAVKSFCSYQSYTLDNERQLDIPYAHYDYVVGDQIFKGDLIGGGIQVWGPKPAEPHWYKHCVWGEGFMLSQIAPFETLLIPNAPVRFEAYATTGGKLHVRPHLPGDAAELTRFWAWIKSAEIASGFYLNDVIGLSLVGDEINLNGVDFWFENGLALKAIVIHLDNMVLTGAEREKCIAFLQREKLVDYPYIVTQ